MCAVCNSEVPEWQFCQRLREFGFMVSNTVIGTSRGGGAEMNESAAAVTHCLDVEATVAVVTTEEGRDMICLIV